MTRLSLFRAPLRVLTSPTQRPARALLVALVLLGSGLVLMPQAARAQRPLGVDVSSYQPGINWSSVKSSGITFAYAKATEGSGYTDSTFLNNEGNAPSAGVLIGAYHFARYDLNQGTSGAVNEANWFWSVAGPYIKKGGAYLMPMLDCEWVQTTKVPGDFGYTAATFSQWVNTWCQTVSNSAFASGIVIKPVIYSAPSFASAWLDSTTTQWTLWMASYNGQDPQTGAPSSMAPWSTWGLWQYTSSASVPGISGSVDADVFNGTLSTLNNTLVIGGAGNSATLVSSSVPGGVLTGQTFTASITFNNSGNSTWTNTGANPYRLGSQNPQDNTTWGLNRVALPTSPVSPGANVTFAFNATAPTTPGVYHFYWRMLQEGVQSFGDTYSQDIVVKLGGPGTNYGSFTFDSGNMDSTARDPAYVAFSPTCTPAVNAWWSIVCYGGTGQNFNRDIRWMPSLASNPFSGRGLVAASALVPSGVPNSYGNGTAVYLGVDASGADLPGPISGSINQCINSSCGWVNFYSNSVNLSSLGGFRSNTTNDSAAASGGCNTGCGYYSAVYSQMRIQAAHWEYIDDWTCLGPYASSSVSDTSNRAFNETNLYLYPAVDSSHGNVIATLMGLSGKAPGHVTTGDCNNANTLNFGGSVNGVSPAGNASAYGNANNADSYGFAWIYAPAGAYPYFVMGSDDGNRLWLNGTLLNDNNSARGLTRDQDQTGHLAIHLATGWNRVLFKVHNFTGGFQGTVSLRNGSNPTLNEPDVEYFDLGGYYSYGLGYEQDGWYPQIVVSSIYGTSSPTNAQAFYGNNPTVTASGTSSGQGPVPYWRTMQYQWGYGLGSADTSYADVSGTPTSTSWSHTTTGVTGHRRLHFFAVSQSGRTSFQSSGANGGSVFQDSGNYARYYDVFVDNVAPLTPAFSSAMAATSQVSLAWAIPPDQGVNVGVGSSESAGAGGNQDGQNWYRVGDVGVQVYRNSGVLSPWSTGTGFTDSGLTPNAAYTYTLEARDNNTNKRGTWHNTTGQQGSTTVWTLSVPPGAGSITPSTSTPHTGTNVTWTAASGFGAGQVQYYRYAWDTTPTHSWTDSEPQWSAGTLSTTATAPGTWYLHIKGYNGAGIDNGSFDYPVTATASASSTALVSGPNPAWVGSNVTFTATVSAVGPDSTVPTGSIVFAANGAPFSTNALVNGSANTTTALLAPGTNTVAAQYGGDVYFLGSAASLQQVIQSACSQTNAIVGIVDNQDGTFTLTFAGTAQSQYYVVGTTDPTQAGGWVPVAGSTNVVSAPNGVWSCTVTNTGAQMFYRSVSLNPCP